MIPFTHTAIKIYQVHSNNNNLRESLMITEKVVNDPQCLDLWKYKWNYVETRIEMEI